METKINEETLTVRVGGKMYTNDPNERLQEGDTVFILSNTVSTQSWLKEIEEHGGIKNTLPVDNGFSVRNADWGYEHVMGSRLSAWPSAVIMRTVGAPAGTSPSKLAEALVDLLTEFDLLPEAKADTSEVVDALRDISTELIGLKEQLESISDEAYNAQSEAEDAASAAGKTYREAMDTHSELEELGSRVDDLIRELGG